MSVRGPSIAGDVYDVPYPLIGVDAPANAPGDMGAAALYGPPGVSWDPRGLGGNMSEIMNYAQNGIAPRSHGHVTLKSFDFVSMQYMCAPTSDRASLMIKRGMPCFIIREFDKEDHSSLIYPLSMLNQISKEQWRDFVLATDPNSPMQDTEKLRFLAWMRKYGDDELCEYAHARETGDMSRYELPESASSERKLHMEQSLQELAEFLDRSEQDGYCYLTKHGWSCKVNFCGANINTNLGAGLESLLNTERMAHYVHANQGFAKRILMGQCFGSSHEVTMGSTLWIVLRREYCNNGKYGPFMLYPGASNLESDPIETRYLDEKGKNVEGIVYKVGTVLEPANRSPQKSVLEHANNTTEYGSAQDAYESFAELPTFYVNMGFKQ